jgi:hypothetical protein
VGGVRLSNVYNSLPAAHPLRLRVYRTVVAVAAKGGRTALLVPQLGQLDAWLAEWQAPLADRRALLHELSDALRAADLLYGPSLPSSRSQRGIDGPYVPLWLTRGCGGRAGRAGPRHILCCSSTLRRLTPTVRAKARRPRPCGRWWRRSIRPASSNTTTCSPWLVRAPPGPRPMPTYIHRHTCNVRYLC